MSKLNDFIQTLKDRLPLSEVIMRHTPLKRTGGALKGLCPFHNEKGPSFNVNDDKGMYHCFGCGAHGDHVDFVLKKLNLNFIEAVQYLADQAGMTVPTMEKKDGSTGDYVPSSESTLFYDIHELTTQWYENQLRSKEATQARDYLTKRRMTKEVAQKFRVGYAPDRGLKDFLLSRSFKLEDIIKCGLVIQPDNGRPPYDRFRGRIMFPIQDRRGRVIAFGGRIMDQGEPKYLNSPETLIFHKGRQLYGLNHSVTSARSGHPYILVEGYMDVIALHQAGLTSAIAPLGTALTPDQLTLMWKTCSKPILCFDGDSAGRRAAYRSVDRVLELINPNHTVEFCFLPEGEDPDSLIKNYSVSALRDLLARPLPLIEVLWQIFMEQRSLKTPEEKAKARKDVLDLTQPIQDLTIRKEFRDDLNRRLQEKIQTLMSKGAPAFKGKNLSFNGTFTQTNLIKPPKNDLNKNKIAWGEKILLASLINHPTLISEVAEQLMMLTSEDPRIETIRQCLLTYFEDNASISHQELMNYMKEKGINPHESDILSRSLYERARFAHPSTPVDQVLIGWQEVWCSIQDRRHLKNEMNMVSTELKSTLNQQSWQRLKLLTRTLTSVNEQRQS